ncbi:FkbM family methyltransferase [Priestia filamentosa]|uniref:FkbM family methyltransferase n=1 Tax=Priestia filamentosa TaxID=1402861 RepID=UPI003F192970
MSSNIMDISKNDVKFSVISNQVARGIWDRIRLNEWEEETFKIFDRFLKSGSSYIDIGAWIGPTVLYGANKAKHVYAVEPDPIAFKELVTNINLNPPISSKVTCINAAIAEKSGNINLYVRGEFGDSMSSLIPTISDKSCEVRGITIHDLINENNIRDVNFVKVDIEGGEYSLIPLLHEFLESQKPTLYLSIHPGFLNENISMSTRDVNTLEQFKSQTEKLLGSLQFYKYIYNNSGKLINEDKILDVKNTGEFVFTNERW